MLSLLEKPALIHLIGPTSPKKLLGSFSRDSIEELVEKKQNFNPIRNKKFRNFSQNEKVAPLSMNNIHSLSFNHGYLSPYFINHPLKKDVELNHPRVLVSETKLHSPEVLKPLIDRLKRNHDSLIIISSEIEWEVLSFLLSQKLNGEIKVVAVTAPGFGNQQVNILEEIAKITGTKPIYTQELKGIEKINYSYLGHCERAVVTRERTLIIR